MWSELDVTNTHPVNLYSQGRETITHLLKEICIYTLTSCWTTSEIIYTLIWQMLTLLIIMRILCIIGLQALRPGQKVCRTKVSRDCLECRGKEIAQTLLPVIDARGGYISVFRSDLIR